MRKALIIFIVLLVVGVVAADRIGVRVAQDEIAKQVAAQYSLQQKPDVTIKGFPFLTQAVSGHYDEIDVKIGDWTQQPENVTVHDLTIKLGGLGAPLGDVINGNTSSITADTATAEAVIPFDVMKRYAPKDVDSISAAGSDLQIHFTVTRSTLIGQFKGAGTAVVSLKPSAKGIAVTPETIKSDGAGSAIPIGLLGGALTFNVPVQNLPIGSRITEVSVTPDGLKVAATAQNVHFDSLPKA